MKNLSKANLGKRFEEMVNVTNEMYLLRNEAMIIKTDAEWKVLFGYRNGYRVPVKAWKPEKGFLDYIGVVRGGKAISFDAKSTKNKTHFPLSNVEQHQFEKMKSFEKMGGLSFLLVHFEFWDETFILSLSDLQTYWWDAQHGGRKSIPHSFFVSKCHRAKQQNGLKIDYIRPLNILK